MMGLFGKTVAEAQKECNHTPVPYFVDMKHTRKGTALIQCICERCGFRYPPMLYDPGEDDPRFSDVIEFTKYVDNTLKIQGLKIDWD